MDLESPYCIICNNDKFDHYLDVECNDNGELFSLKKCKCSLVMTVPRPILNDIDKYYMGSYLPHLNINSKGSFLNNILRKISYSWKAKLIKRYVIDKEIKLLDIGGGDGALAVYLKNKITKVHVYERNLDCIKSMMDKDIYSTNNLNDLKINDYNLLTSFHSLEHIHDMDELFLNINRISSKACRMIIAVPNIEASEIKFLNNKWVAWDVPRHLYHFSPRSLKLLLEKHGWEIIKSKNMFQDTIFNIYMSLSGNFAKRIVLFSFLIIYSFICQIFFVNLKSTNLVICQKK